MPSGCLGAGVWLMIEDDRCPQILVPDNPWKLPVLVSFLKTLLSFLCGLLKSVVEYTSAVLPVLRLLPWPAGMPCISSSLLSPVLQKPLKSYPAAHIRPATEVFCFIISLMCWCLCTWSCMAHFCWCARTYVWCIRSRANLCNVVPRNTIHLLWYKVSYPEACQPDWPAN